MGKLIQLENADLLKEGADPYQVWRAVKELWEKINAIDFTVFPTHAGHFEIEEGVVKADLKVITQRDAIDSIPGYSPPGASTSESGSKDSPKPYGSSG